MFNVCPSCGLYSVEKTIRPGTGWEAEAICPTCGYAHPFLRLPLFVISGASGTGKTTVGLRLARTDSRCIHLESDILWRAEFNRPENDYRDYRNLWLRVAKNIGQAGRPVALYGSASPSQFEDCPERRYFSQVHYLALVCDPQRLAERLRARPAWRSSGTEAFVANMIQFNRWFIENAAHSQPLISLLDTTHASPDETAAAVLDWILAGEPDLFSGECYE